jgi:hypothetical protein
MNPASLLQLPLSSKLCSMSNLCSSKEVRLRHHRLNSSKE